MAGAAAEIDRRAHWLVSSLTPPDFMAVGEYYRGFAAPTDDQVQALLRVAPPAR